MALIIQEGGMPTLLSGVSGTGWYFTNSGNLDEAQLSLDGTTWASSISIAGGTLSIGMGTYDAVQVNASGLTAKGYFSFFVRARDTSGWSAAYQTSVRVYTGSAAGFWRTSTSSQNSMSNNGDEPALPWVAYSYSTTARTIDGVAIPANRGVVGSIHGTSFTPLGWFGDTNEAARRFSCSLGAIAAGMNSGGRLYNGGNPATPAFTASTTSLTAARQFALLGNEGVWQYLVESPAPTATSGTWTTTFVAVTKDTVLLQHQASTSGATLSLSSGSIYVSGARTILVAHNIADGSIRWAIGIAGTASVSYTLDTGAASRGIHGDGTDIAFPYAWTAAATVGGVAVAAGTGLLVLNAATGAVRYAHLATTAVLTSARAGLIATGVYVLALSSAGAARTIYGSALPSGSWGVYAVNGQGVLIDSFTVAGSSPETYPFGTRVGIVGRFTQATTIKGKSFTYNSAAASNFIIGPLGWSGAAFDVSAVARGEWSIAAAGSMRPLGNSAGALLNGGTTSGATNTITLYSKDTKSLTTAASGDWVGTMSNDGAVGEVSAAVGVPGGENGNVEPPTPPAVSPTDPQVVDGTEDQPVAFLLASADPENTQGATAKIQLWDPQLREFFTTPIVSGASGSQVRQDRTITDPSTGKTYTVRIVQSGETEPSLETSPAYLTAAVIITAEANVNGHIYTYGRTVLTLPDGTNRMSASKLIDINLAPVWDSPGTPYILREDNSMPDISEGQTSSAQWRTDNPDGYTDVTFTWQLRDEQSEATLTNSGNLTVRNGAGNIIGTAHLSSNGTRTCSVSFTPVEYWSGQASFDIRVANGGDGTLGNEGWSSWATVRINVNFVNDAPTAPKWFGRTTIGDPASSPATTTLAAFDEDSDPLPKYLLEWSDADWDPESPQGWELELAPNLAGLPMDEGWGSTALLDGVVVRVVNEDLAGATDNLSAQVRIEPEVNWNGTLTFRARVNNTSETNPESASKYSPVSIFTVTIHPSQDRPTAPQPSTMPTIDADFSAVAEQEFTTTDPDSDEEHGAPWTFQVSATAAGPWQSTVTLANGISVVVNDADTSDKAAAVRAHSNGASGSYEFWIRVMDAAGEPSGVSPATRVVGFIVPRGLTVELRRTVRTETSFDMMTVCPLTPNTLKITEALNGPGGVNLTVDSQEVAARAADADLTVAQLLDPAAMEVVVYADGLTVFAGPITGYSADLDNGTVDITASGLLSYFETRRIEPGKTTAFVAKTDGEIVGALVADAQALPYGSLGISVDVDNDITTTRTMAFAVGDTLAAAFTTLLDSADASEVWITPERVLRASRRRGTDLRGGKRGVVFTERNCVGLTQTAADDELATVVVITNSDGSITGEAMDVVAAQKYGRIVRYIKAPNVVTQAAADALAAEVLRRRSRAYAAPTFTHISQPDAPFTVWDYAVGDAVSLEVDDSAIGTIRQDARILARTINLEPSTPGAYTVDLDVELIPVKSDGSRGDIEPGRSRGVADLMDEVYDALYLRRA